MWICRPVFRPHLNLESVCPSARFAKLTEVQHLYRVLPWEMYISTSPLRSGVNWPGLRDQGLQSAHPGKDGSLARELNQPTLLDRMEACFRYGRGPVSPSRRCRGSKWTETPCAPYRLRLPAWRLVPGTALGRSPGCGSRMPIVSRETIYRFIQCQIDRREDLFLAQPAAPQQGQTGPPGSQGRQFHFLYPPSSAHLPAPSRTDDRATPGHWEADLMLFGNQGQSLLTLQERYSRLTLTGSPGGLRRAWSAITQLLAIPPQWRPVPTKKPSTTATEFSPPLATPRTRVPRLVDPRWSPGRRAAWRMPTAGCALSSPARPTCPSCPQTTSPGSPKPQPHPPQVPGLPDPGRNLIQTTVALEM